MIVQRKRLQIRIVKECLIMKEHCTINQELFILMIHFGMRWGFFMMKKMMWKRL